MISYESRKVRHIVARLERGERLHEALGNLAEEHGIGAAWLSALGAFESCELAEYDQSAQQYQPARRVDAPSEILNLTGNISFKDGEPFGHVHATISREEGDSIRVLGGHLVDAVVFACELRLDIYDDLVLGREHDAATGLSLWGSVPNAEGPPTAPTGVAPQVETPPASASGLSWAQVAEASTAPEPEPEPEQKSLFVTRDEAAPRRLSLAERRRQAKARQAERKKEKRFAPEGPTAPVRAPEPLPKKRKMTEEEFFEELIPEIDDYVDHRVFGVCRVEAESETGGLIIRMENGVRKSIRLDVLEVQPPRIAAGRKVFPLRPKRRK